MSIIGHAEKYLGKVSGGWKDKKSDEVIQVLYFQNMPASTVDTFLTAGLSDHILHITETKSVRQELLLASTVELSKQLATSLLLHLCDCALQKHEAFLRGQVVKLPTEAAQMLRCGFVYCAIPVFLDEDFSTLNETKPPTVIVWIIPIHVSEAHFIESNGWEKFEDVLEKENPNLFLPLSRPSVV